MNRAPVSSTSTAPSPRSASVTSGMGSSPTVERGRVELHELQVGQRRAGPRRQRQPLADGAQRVGGMGEEPAEPAGRQHHAARGQQAGIERSRRQHAGDTTVVDQQAARPSPSITVIDGVGLHRARPARA